MTTVPLTVTLEEIAQFRSELANYPQASLREQALKELEVVENCNGDLEAATRVLARRVEESVRKGDYTFDNLVDKSRKILCKPEIMEKLAKAKNPLIVFDLVAVFFPPPFPQIIVTLILIQMGVEGFCNSDKSKH
ncbi:hypothetical protein BJP34_14825 [Moorena producens PAL-8-15-08-1]|uniref:Uncharacterized protein n=1 Tax=Moorena producens PAL-8-15-08-1 TaxID=1458985 RepID=A0A1D8TSD9_9CYAN|nr:hypothetical protein [Moorena producens]AOX00548.1 hypothetical protein BJP34_14825 [Moorena producens PAL-8-15-08-1]